MQFHIPFDGTQVILGNLRVVRDNAKREKYIDVGDLPQAIRGSVQTLGSGKLPNGDRGAIPFIIVSGLNR